MNRKARVTQAEIERALRAIKASGIVMAIEITPDGILRIVPALEPTSEPGRKAAPYRGPVPAL